MLKLVNNPFLRRGGNFSLRVQVSLFVLCNQDSVNPLFFSSLNITAKKTLGFNSFDFGLVTYFFFLPSGTLTLFFFC